MTIFFCINDVIDQIENLEDSTPTKNALIQVATEKIDCNGYNEDAFTLTSSPKIMDLESGDAPYQVSSLIEEVPLYHVQMITILDSVLAERHVNAVLNDAIKLAFKGETIPETLEEPKEARRDDLPGSLQHPQLENMTPHMLSSIYIDFINHLKRGYELYGFQERILAKQPDQFLSFYDGFIFRGIGKVKAPILLGFGLRLDHDPGMSMESHVQRGQQRAREMNVLDSSEMLWAWLESDNFQMRRCFDLHRLLTMEKLPRVPNWVRTDVFKLLENEAMKQYFAARLKELEPDLGLLANMPLTKETLLSYSINKTDQTLKQLASELLNPGIAYTGIAKAFYEKAQIRTREAQESRFM
jgi:hypothetical protein